MPITPIEVPNILGSYVQGLELGRQARAQRAKEAQALELRNMLAAATPEQLEDPRFINQLIVRPGGAEIAKPLAESLTARQGMRKNELEIMKLEVETLAGEAGSFLRAYKDNPASLNKASVAPWLNSAVRRGLMNPEDLQTFEAMPDDPAQLAIELKKLEEQGLTVAQRLDAEAKARTAGIQERQAAVAEREITEKEAEGRAKRAAAKSGAKEDEDVVARTETAADGTVRMYNKYGKLLKTETGAGKPSATFEKTKAGREEMQRNLNETLSSLRDIIKPGGLIDQSTGSGFGRGVDIGARFFGTATKGDIALGKLAPIADQVLKLVPRFEGPQSDKDTQSYREAAGQLADGTLPNEIRKEAAKTIIDLYTRRKNQFTIQGAETAGGDGSWQDL